jgi:hypothetical protein
MAECGDRRACLPSHAIAVAVPVRNEVRRLPALIEALARQQAAPAFALCLFFDNCGDGSQQCVADLAPTLPFAVHALSCDEDRAPNAGYARRRAMAVALGAAPHGILLTTDADSVPAPNWIQANLAALATADIVAGRIVREPCNGAPLQDRVEAYYQRLHALRRTIDPVPWDDGRSHHWTSGASLAMRAAVYRALEGFPAVPSGEDALFCDAAARRGYAVARDAEVVVETSARRHGRARNGFAAGLATLDADARLPDTAHPEDEIWRFQLHAIARAHHGSGKYGALAGRLGLALAEVEQVARECRNGEAFAARVVGTPPGGVRRVGLAYAERRLSAFEQVELETVA